MRITQTGPGYVHVPKSLIATDEFEQMTAARLMPVVVQGKQSMRWITPGGKREEAGDCQVYAYAAACHLGIQTYRDPSWDRRERKYAPREPDLFAAPPPPEAPPPQLEVATPAQPARQPATTKPRRPTGAFVKGWK